MTARSSSRRDPMLPERFRIAARRQETQDTWTLTLRPLDRAAPFDFAPGQFNMVYVFGAGEVPISISGDPTEPDQLVHTVRAVGAATRAICSAPKGDVLGIRGPFGSRWPLDVADGGDVVVVAGGVGLAPVRPIVRHVIARRDRYRNAVLLYGSREPEQLLYSQELEEWRRSGFEVSVTVDFATGAWRGSVGVVPKLVARARLDPDVAVAFVCGPEAMMRFSAEALLERGVSANRIFVSLERNMKCAVGHCGHCQLGPDFVCRDGPVFGYADVTHAFTIREL